MLKKILSIILLVCTILCLCCSCSKETKITSTKEYAEYIVNSKEQHYSIDNKNNSFFKLNLSYQFNNNLNTTISSSKEEGYYSVTFSYKLSETDTVDIFTIYCSDNDSYKSKQYEKNYTVLGNDGTYTFVWYEDKIDEKYSVSEDINGILKELPYIKASAKNKNNN